MQTLQLRKAKQRYAGCPVMTRTVAAINAPDYAGYLELAGRLALEGAKGAAFSPEQRAIELIRFGAVDCLYWMAEAAGWTCPAMGTLRATPVNSEEDISKLACLVSEANVQFVRYLEANRTKVRGGTNGSTEWQLAEQILLACLFAGGSVRVDEFTESQLGVAEMLFSFLSVEAVRRNPKAEKTVLRRIRTRFIKLLERLSA